ncbi:MAG: hypothetical protein AAF984_03115 [Verrucomicrobiota bacterium]
MFKLCKITFGLVLTAVLSVFVSCASTSTGEEDQVSTLPWNSPQSWEGQGALGGIVGEN